ncbi:hypothetical protein HON49_05680, partial [archaeon]|nr:hypothetical protein [archaeon]
RGGENYKYDFGVRDDLLYSFKTGGTAVIHSWARDLSFNQLIRHVTDNPAYRLITKEKFVYPSQKKIPSDECEWNLYGQGAISKARKLAEEHESSLVLLHVKRGIGQLDLQADLYEKN